MGSLIWIKAARCGYRHGRIPTAAPTLSWLCYELSCAKGITPAVGPQINRVSSTSRVLLLALVGDGHVVHDPGSCTLGSRLEPQEPAEAIITFRAVPSGDGAKPMTFTLNAAMLQPIVALLAGILILLIPRILNFVVAIYLIFIGVTGLWPHLLSALSH
jgi:Protein of unknown function (DUF3096)